MLEEIRKRLKYGPVIVLLNSDCGEAVEINTEEELNSIALLL